MVKTLRIDNIGNFAIFNLYTVAPKILYLQRYSTIFEIFAWARRRWGWAFGWQVSGSPVFYFCNGKVITLRIDNIWDCATFNLYTVPAKILYLQRYSNDFRNPCLSSKMLREGIWVKVSGALEFYFCNGRVKNLRIDNIWDCATFNLYTVPAKVLYLQGCSMDFRNLCLSSKTVRVGIWVESFRGPGVLLLQWQGENFADRQHLKFCHFQPVHCGRKNYISPKVFNRFSKSLPQLEDVEGGHLAECFRCAGILNLHWQGEYFPHRRHLKFCHFHPVHCASKNPMSP